jgi:signal peptidase I
LTKEDYLSSFVRELIGTILVAVVIFFGINGTLQNSEVIGYSMVPNLQQGERIFINKLAYKFGHEPQRGDIIVLVPPAYLASPNDYIKRVIGLPGERVEIKGGVVYIHKTDGSTLTLEEPYVADPALQTFEGGVIAPDNYFVMGDNRNNSGDSRQGWTIPRKDIVGKALVVIWPPSRWGAPPNYKLPV